MFINKTAAVNNNICGKRFVTDIEIIAFTKVLGVSFEDLLIE